MVTGPVELDWGFILYTLRSKANYTMQEFLDAPLLWSMIMFEQAYYDMLMDRFTQSQMFSAQTASALGSVTS